MGIVRNQSIKNSIYFYIGLVLGALSTIILYPNAFNSHPENLGLLQIIVAYSTVISTFSYLGTPKTLIRFFPKVENKNQLITLAFLIPIIGFLLFLFLYVIFKDQFLQLISANKLLIDNFNLVFFLVAFLSFFEVLSSLSRSLLNATIPIFLKEIFLKGMNIFLLFLHWFNYIDFSTFLNLFIFMYLGMIVILSISIFRKFSYKVTFNFNEIESKKLIVFGLYVLAGGASAMLVSKVDMMMIGKLMDLEQVAFYTVAFFIGNVIRVPGRAIGSIATPLIAKAWERNDINEIKDIYIKSSINQLLFGGLIFLGVWLNIDDGLSLLPEKFQGGSLVVLFIALSQLFNVATGINGIIIVNSRYYKFDLYSNFILLCITLYTNWIFIPESSPLSEYHIVGINGAAFATALSVLIFNTIKLIFLYIKMAIHPFTFNTIKAIVLIIVVYLSIYNITFPDNVFYSLFLRFSMLFAIYIPLMILFNISEDVNKTLSEVWNKYFKKS
jgi:O-antigen/teichoic acid export membrane protein